MPVRDSASPVLALHGVAVMPTALARLTATLAALYAELDEDKRWRLADRRSVDMTLTGAAAGDVLRYLQRMVEGQPRREAVMRALLDVAQAVQDAQPYMRDPDPVNPLAWEPGRSVARMRAALAAVEAAAKGET